MKKLINLSFVLLILLSASSCGKKKTKKQAEADEITITEYLTKNNISAIATGTGLYYIIDSTTNGAKPTPNSNVSVAYKGYYVDGTVFDQSSAIGVNFNLQSVIRGWTEGIPYFPEGSKGRLFIPSNLGYGLKDYNDIPGGSVLIFDIHLIEF